MARLKLLLTEGTTTSARQVLYALAPLRAVIDVCDSHPLSSLTLASFQRRACIRCPAYNREPQAFLRFLRQRLRNFHYDAILPTHDEIFALAAFRSQLGRYVPLPVPDFDALRQLQSKASFIRLLDALRLPSPHTVIGRKRTELSSAWDGPCFVKLAHATAGCGVWHAESEPVYHRILERLERNNRFDGRGEILVQQQVPGTLCVAQAIFQHGRLVAWHGYQARALGVGGSPRARSGIFHPQVKTDVEKLGSHLHWHGAMFIDYSHDEQTGGPAYIDANPRIGEIMNAALSGVNLALVLIQVARGEALPGCQIGQPGCRTHSVLTSLLHVAQQHASRPALVRELLQALRRRGVYENSVDELTRLRDDPPSSLPLCALIIRLLLQPGSGDKLLQRSVAKYGLDEEAATAIRSLRHQYDAVQER